MPGDSELIAYVKRLLGYGITGLVIHHILIILWGIRMQRAKRLLDETDLPMTEIAFRAGFGSLRRFNAVFAEVYRRPPSAVRQRPA